MKNITMALAGLTILGACVFGYMALANNSQPASRDTTQQNTTDQQNPVSEKADGQTAQQQNNGEYVEYSDGVIASAQGDVYLFFHAPWCPQCRSIESGIESGGVPDGVTVVKVDYDTNQDLRQKYGVTLQTTFVKVNKNGDFISKFVAYSDPQFSSVVRDYINK